MKYKEYAPPRAWSFWLLLIFLLLLLPLCWLPRLNSAEASMALIAREMQDIGDFFTFKLFGNEQFTLPFLPWILAAMGKVMPVNEFTIRLLGIIPVGLLGVLCYWVVRRVAELKTGPVAAAVAMSLTVIVFQKGVSGDGYMLYALFINLAWFLFYYFGRIKRRWLLAWFLSHLFLSFALLTVGLKAVFLFYFPLMWLRWPLNIRRRMITAEHTISLGVTLLLLTGLFAMIPDLRNNLSGFLTTFGTSHLDGYFTQLIEFPFMAVAGTLPWTFLAWPSFCMAFRPLEKDPVFANYNRTIVSSIFFFFWLVPSRGPTELLPLVGPFAVLVAVNYDVLVRRYGNQLLRLVQATAIITLVIAAAWVVGGFFQSREGVGLLSDLRPQAAEAATFMACCSVVLAGILIKWTPKYPIWLLVLLSVLMLKLMYAGTYFADRFKKDNKHRQLTAELAEHLPEAAVVYEVLPRTGYQNLPSEWYYLGHDVIKLKSGEKLPNTKEVYVIGGKHEPTIESVTVLPNEESVPREWTPLTREIPYKDKMVFTVWKGVRDEQVFTWRATDLRPNVGPVRYSKVDTWNSSGGALTQPKPSCQPRWLSSRRHSKPTLQFDGGQYLQQDASALQKHLELEHTFVLAVKLSRRNDAQVLLDIRGNGDEAAAILQRIDYNPKTHTITSSSRDTAGNSVTLQGQHDLSYASIIIVRRNKELLELFVNKKRLASEVHSLQDIENEQMTLYLGARGTDKEPDMFMYGELSEFRIMNRWLGDHRIHATSDSLLKTHFERYR